MSKIAQKKVLLKQFQEHLANNKRVIKIILQKIYRISDGTDECR